MIGFNKRIDQDFRKPFTQSFASSISRTCGNGPNDVCEIGWQDVVLGDDGLCR